MRRQRSTRQPQRNAVGPFHGLPRGIAMIATNRQPTLADDRDFIPAGTFH